MSLFGDLGNLCGYKFIECPSAMVVSKIPVRNHKSKRIRKKWIKRYGFKMIPSSDIYIVGNTILAHPTIISKIKNQIQRKDIL